MGSTPIRPSGASKTEFITITSGILSAKQATLSGIPVVPGKVLVDAGGVAQTDGSDYSISGNVISWSGMGLETVLGSGDILRVQYFIL